MNKPDATTPAASTAALAGIRALFERWWSDEGRRPEAIKYSYGNFYALRETQEAWFAWKACATALAPRESTPAASRAATLPADIRALLEACQRWHNGSDWRHDVRIERRVAWQEHGEAIASALAAQPASPAPLTEVPWDGCLNDLGWKMNSFLTDNGAVFNGHVFNNMKGFLRDCITEWLVAHPAALASPQVAPAPVPVQSESHTEHANPAEVAELFRRIFPAEPVAPGRREVKKVIPGDELHLTILGAPYGFNFLTGKDRQDVLAFGRAVWAAALAAPVQVAPRPEASVLNDQIREVVEYHEGRHRFSPLKHSPDPVTRAGWKKQMDAIESVLDALPDAEGEATGWPPGMLQDDDRKLSRALAGTPHARAHADEAAAAIKEMERIRFAAPTSPTPDK